MNMPFSYDEEPEKYSSFKKRKFHDYEQKAKRLLTGINDLSLRPKDKLKLREELSLILSVPSHETPKVRINKANGSLCDNYARCRQSKKHALDCVNDIKYSCFKHERS